MTATVTWTAMTSPGQLRVWCPGIEECWGGMGEPSVRHQVVGLDCSIHVVTMDAHRHSHQHVLWPFHDWFKSNKKKLTQ